MPNRNEIEAEARSLAQSYVQTEPGLRAVYWFPDQKNEEIRIIDIVDGYSTSPTVEKIAVFVFKHMINHNPIKLLVGTIPPTLENMPVVPDEWGTWQQALKVYG